MNKVNTILILFFFATQLLAQEKIDSSKVKKAEYAIYPMIFYTPETQLAFGGGGMVYSRLGFEQGLPPSKINLSAYYTTNNQYYILVQPILYFGGSAGIISESKLIYSNEIWRYYGIGGDAPDVEDPEFRYHYFRFYTEFGFEVDILQSIHVGLIYEFTTNDIVDKGNIDELNNDLVLGSDGGKTSGFGLLAISDHRDNIFFPTKNGYLKFRMIFNGKDLGGDFTYQRYVLDIRRYFDIGKSNIIAGQVYFESTHGDVPFFKMPMLGGTYKMRGYFWGRYRDQAYVTWQVEYRKMFWWRLGAVAFFGMGDVASRIKNLNLTDFKYSYGFGLRFLFDEKEHLNIRMDIGFGRNTNGIYFALEEAF